MRKRGATETSDLVGLRVSDADLRAVPVINAVEKLANGDIRDRDLGRLAHASDDELKAAVDVMACALPHDFDLTMRAVSVAARALLEARKEAGGMSLSGQMKKG